MNNILQTFYVLFQSDADKAAAETKTLEHGAEAAALSVEALGAAYYQSGAMGAEAAATVTAANVLEAASYLQTGGAAAEAGVAAVAAHEAAAVAAGEETAAEIALGEAYKFNRMQRQELVGLARHSFDQLASGGSLMRVVASHAATLAEALGSGEGGLAAGFNALAAAAGRFVLKFGLPLAGIAALVALVGTARGSVKDLEADRLMAGRVNMDVADLDALRKTVRNLGGDTKETDRDLERFANRVDDAFGGKSLEGGKGDRIIKTLHGIGVKTTDANGKLKDTKALLLEVAGALEGKTKAQQSEALRNLGFSSPRHGQTDPAMEKLLTGGRAAMEEYIETEKKLGGVTDEQVEKAHKFKIESEILGDRLRDVRNTIAQYILPILTDLVSAIKDVITWMRLNSTLVTGFGVAFLTMATAVSVGIWAKLIPAFTALAIRVLAATWPFVLIAAAILSVAAIFAAVYEDINFFLKGQPSLLGELVKKYAWVKDALHAVADAFRFVGKEAKDAWALAKRAVADFATFFGPFFSGVAKVAGPVLKLIFDLAVAIAKVLGPILAQAAKTLFDLTVGLAKAFGTTIQQIAHLIAIAFAEAAKMIGPAWHDMFQGWLTQLYALIAGVRELAGLRPDAQLAGGGRAQPQPANDHDPKAPRQRPLEPVHVPAQLAGVVAGQRSLAIAGSTRLSAQTPLAISHGARTTTKSHSVHIDHIDVHTQATDADGIAKGIGEHLGTELRRTVSAFDDGVDR